MTGSQLAELAAARANLFYDTSMFQFTELPVIPDLDEEDAITQMATVQHVGRLPDLVASALTSLAEPHNHCDQQLQVAHNQKKELEASIVAENKKNATTSKRSKALHILETELKQVEQDIKAASHQLEIIKYYEDALGMLEGKVRQLQKEV